MERRKWIHMKGNQPQDFLLHNDLLKLCSICGEEKKLTFEHMPPKKSGNDNPVNIVGLENMTPLGGYMYQNKKKSPKGFGGYKLCKECNNLTGSYYAESYIDHSIELCNGINHNQTTSKFQVTCKLKPLNFVKQVLCILVCSDQATGLLRDKINSKSFLLNKHEYQIPNDIFIRKQITTQPYYGFKGYTSEWDNINGFTQNILFVYRPFCFKVVFDEKQVEKNSMDMNGFLKYKYDEEIEIKYDLQIPNREKRL